MSAYQQLPSVGNFADDVLLASQQRLIVLMFTAAWCTPCRLLARSLQQIQTQNVNTVSCLKIELTDAAPYAEAWQIQSLPTLCFVHHGQRRDSCIGLLPLADLQARIDRILSAPSRPIIAAD